MSNKNPYTGSDFDSFLLEEGIELLEKGKCVRCGGKTSGGKGSRCASCLKKLATKRKTPGTKERSWQHADQALRRERCGSGTTTGGHKSGHGKRQEIQRKMRAAEKKTGQKLSLDRKNNERGYESKNTRAIPEKLNRGRHTADPKKLRAWKKRLKKAELDTASLYTLMKSKFYDDEDTQNLLKSLGPDGLAQYIELFDDDVTSEDMNKAIPKTSTLPDAYSFTEHGPSLKGYTGKDAKAGQVSAVKAAMSLTSPEHKNIKRMINPMTDKEELHILTHRGIGGRGKATETDKVGPNALSIGDKHVEQSHHAVHTLDPKVAESYGERHSFWVPVSHFVGTRSYIGGRYKDPNQKVHPDDIEYEKQMVREANDFNAKYVAENPHAADTFPPEPELTDEQAEAAARQTRSFDPQSLDESHVLVKPGKFHRHQD